MSEIKYTLSTTLKDGHSKGITSLVFNPEGSLLATGGLDGAVCVWDTKSWKLLDVYYAKTSVTSLAWFTNEALVCGLEDGIMASLVKDGEVSGSRAISTHPKWHSLKGFHACPHLLGTSLPCRAS